nr:unnamed protein product [Spirometra erinaceieuropaei]
MPMHNRVQPVHGVSGHYGRQMDMLSSSAPTAALELYQPSSSSSLLHCLSRCQITLIVIPNDDYHPPTPPPPPPPPAPPPLLLLRCPNGCRCGACYAHQDCAQSWHSNKYQRHLRRHQMCGRGLHLSSLRPHLHLTPRSRRSLANPSHSDWGSVPRASTYTLRILLHCSYRDRTFTHRTDLLGHMSILANVR